MSDQTTPPLSELDHLRYAHRQLTIALEKADDAPASAAQHEIQAYLALLLQRIPTHSESLNGWATFPDASATRAQGWQDYKALYHELIYEVAKKHPNETRHETARRYIREREMPTNNTAECKSPFPAPPGSGE